MNIQGLGGFSSFYPSKILQTQQSKTSHVSSGSDKNPASDKVTFSSQSLAMARADQEMQNRLNAIESKPAAQRTSDEVAFVLKNDKKLSEITKKDQSARTAEEISYTQKAGGFVNTFSNFSPSEMKLYDDLVAKGDSKAAEGMSMIALSRMMDTVSLPGGGSFNPKTTEITAANIKNLFVHAFANLDASQSQAFDSLQKYLSETKSA